MYDVEICRANPGLFWFLIDQSDSMNELFGSAQEGGQSQIGKAQGVADAVNRLLSTIIIRCTKPEGVRPYFDISVTGYGTQVGPAFTGQLKGRELVSVPEIADNPARIETRTRKVSDNAGGLVDESFRLPIWFDPVGQNGTPMCEALRHSYTAVERWVSTHRQSFPPIIMNLTDGEATDGDPSDLAEALKRLSTDDGNVLVLNCHISSQPGPKVLFPDDEAGLPDEFARRLFRMSSELPPGLIAAARSEGFQIGEHARGFVFNGDLVDVVRFLDIGTRSSAGLR